MPASRKGGRRPGAGRKPKPPGERQRNAVVAKLTDDEFKQLRRVAGETGLGTYVRTLILRHLARKR